MQQIPLQQTPWLILYNGICGWYRVVSAVSVTPDRQWLKSTTALKILNHLEEFLPIFCIFRTIPLSLGIGIYVVIARHRYRLREKLTLSYLPPKEYQDRFFHDA